MIQGTAYDEPDTADTARTDHALAKGALRPFASIVFVVFCARDSLFPYLFQVSFAGFLSCSHAMYRSIAALACA